MEFVSYDRFKDVEFIAEGGFSTVYKATLIDGSIGGWSRSKRKYRRYTNELMALKKLNNSKNITSKELQEVCSIIHNSLPFHLILINIEVKKCFSSRCFIV